MPTDKAVPMGAMHYLNPCHIDLHKSGASPLSCFEHDETNGLVVGAHIFKNCQNSALRSVERERNASCRYFVLDSNATSAPELKIVSDAQGFHFGKRCVAIDAMLSEHLGG